jgi:hypothetical protein
MRISLIDIDNKYREKKRRGKLFPNLALMKISAFHKLIRDDVGFNLNNADDIYISCVFEKNKPFAMEEIRLVKGLLHYGGSGLSINSVNNLPEHIEKIKPDYDLYPSEYSLGFTTRGCIRKCPFCIVHEKEGLLRRTQHVKEFHDFKFKSCKLLDNNILADKEWFFENTNWAIENKVQLDITQGLDIRLLTDEIAEQLHKIKFVDQQIRFAWDSLIIEDSVKSGIETLRDHKINIRRNVSFYVLCGFNTTIEQDIYRCNKLKDWNVMAFVMKYHETNKILNHLARWANKREIYRSTTFEEYLKLKEES